MNRDRKGTGDAREEVTFSLPSALMETMREFCRDKKVPPDTVAERALEEYFREGDMSH